VLSRWVLRLATGGGKAGGEADEQGYEVEDTSATATEVDEASSGTGGKGGVGKRRRVKKGRR